MYYKDIKENCFYEVNRPTDSKYTDYIGMVKVFEEAKFEGEYIKCVRVQGELEGEVLYVAPYDFVKKITDFP